MPTDRVPSTIYAAGTAELQAAVSDGDGLPRFTMVAYTGGAMNLGGWAFPVVVDLAGMKVTAKSRPVLRDHDPGKIVGHTTEVDRQPKRLTASGVISADNLFSREVVSSAGNGFPWQSSIGADVNKVVFVEEGESVEVNGRSFTGPLYVARRTTLGEISFVPLGADDATSARLAAAAASSVVRVEPMNFEKWLEGMGLALAELNDDQQTKLRAKFDGEQKALVVTQGNARAEAAQQLNAQKQTPSQDQSQAERTQTLEQIFAEQRKEQARIDEITRITAENVRERPMMTDELEKMSAAAIAGKHTPEAYELAVLRASRPTPGVIRKPVDRKVGEKVVTAALCKAGGLKDIGKHFDERTLEAADDQYEHGIGLKELLLLAARENGHQGISQGNIKAMLQAAFPQQIQAQGWSTFSLAGIMGNVANKFLAAGFNAVESSWRQIAAVKSVTDFRQITSYSLTGGFQYEKVGPQGELKHAEVGEESYTNRAETYGRMFAISRQDIINDDLGALTEIPMKLGRGAALKLNDIFWTKFMDNAAFFTALRGNYDEDTDTALSIAGLGLANNLFLAQTDPDGYPLGIQPRIVLVPTGLGVTASQLSTETRVIDGTGTALQPASNPWAGMFRVVQSSYLSNTNYTGASATAWYLLADPNDLPVIQVVFLNGRDTPTVESADADFNTLGVQFRGYQDMGAELQEYRAGVLMAGVNV